MKEKIRVLVLTSSFPRSKKDWWAQFIFHIYETMPNKIYIILLGPDAPQAKKIEKFGKFLVRRFSYFYPRSLQLLTTGSGILHSSKSNLFARFQIPLFILSAAIHSCIYAFHSKPDLFHAHWLIPQGLIGVFIKKIFNTSLIVTVHGSDIFGLKRLRFLKRFVLKNCDVCTVNSSYTKQAVLMIYAKTRISIIPMGVDIQQFSPKRKSVSTKKKLNPSGGPILLCVGRLIGVKGFEYAIKSMPSIIAKFPDSVLVIIGDGPKREELVLLSRELNVENYIKFIPSIAHDRLSFIYASSDICLVPSVSDPNTGETESQGIVVLEAMASGVPVIGSNSGGITDAIIHNKNGLLVPPGDAQKLSNACIQILSNTVKANRLRETALRISKDTYQWSKISKQFEVVYQKILYGQY